MQTTFVRQTAENGEDSGASASGPAERGTNRAARTKLASFKSRNSSGTHADRGLIESLSNSKIFQDYGRAFTEATGLPVALRAVESWQLPHHGQPYSVGLPECRAYEMVSPLDKQAHDAETSMQGLGLPVSPDGETVGFTSQ